MGREACHHHRSGRKRGAWLAGAARADRSGERQGSREGRRCLHRQAMLAHSGTALACRRASAALKSASGYGNFHLYVVSAFRRTRHGPAKAGHYIQNETALDDELAPDRQGEPDHEQQDAREREQRPRAGRLRQRPWRGRR